MKGTVIQCCTRAKFSGFLPINKIARVYDHFSHDSITSGNE